MAKDSLLDLFSKATAEDLEKVRSQIAAKEKELESVVAAYQKELDGLRAVEKCVDLKLNGKPPRAARGTGKAAQRKAAAANGHATSPPPAFGAAEQPNGGLIEKRKKLLMHLKVKERGDKSQLASLLGINLVGWNNMSTVLNHEWFHVAPNNIVTLTDKGDRADP